MESTPRTPITDEDIKTVWPQARTGAGKLQDTDETDTGGDTGDDVDAGDQDGTDSGGGDTDSTDA